MLILEKLWYGELAPWERRCRKSSLTAKLAQELSENEEAFCQELSKEGKQRYGFCCDQRAKIAAECECDAFISGVQIGARLMLDMLSDGPFSLAQLNNKEDQEEANHVYE